MRIISRRARPHKITLYNLASSAGGVATYQRTVIDRVLLDESYQQRLAQKGVSTADTAQLIIDLRDIDVTSNRVYSPAKEWTALADKTGHFTFNPTSDFFVAGEASETMPSATKQQMLAKYKCFSVTNVATPASDQSGPIVLEITGR